MKQLLWRFCNNPHALILAVVGNIIGSGLLFALLEGLGPITGAWWAMVTGSTTGYGDFFPKTTEGRAVAVWLMSSMWFLSLVAGAQLTARMVADPHCFTDEEQKEMHAMVSEIRDFVRQNQYR